MNKLQYIIENYNDLAKQIYFLRQISLLQNPSLLLDLDYYPEDDPKDKQDEREYLKKEEETQPLDWQSARKDFPGGLYLLEHKQSTLWGLQYVLLKQAYDYSSQIANHTLDHLDPNIISDPNMLNTYFKIQALAHSDLNAFQTIFLLSEYSIFNPLSFFYSTLNGDLKTTQKKVLLNPL